MVFTASNLGIQPAPDTNNSVTMDAGLGLVCLTNSSAEIIKKTGRKIREKRNIFTELL